MTSTAPGSTALWISAEVSELLAFDNYIAADECSSNPGMVGSWSLDPPELGPNIVGGPYVAGNYWSDYSGVDLDSDWLGDTGVPHHLDPHPLIRPPSLYSPNLSAHLRADLP